MYKVMLKMKNHYLFLKYLNFFHKNVKKDSCIKKVVIQFKNICWFLNINKMIEIIIFCTLK